MSNQLLPPFYYGHASMKAKSNPSGATWPKEKERGDESFSEEDVKDMEGKGITVRRVTGE